MTSQAQLVRAVLDLVAAMRPIGELTGVPMDTLVAAVLSAAGLQDAELLAEVQRASAFALQGGVDRENTDSIVPTSDSYEHMLSLIERDNPQLYKKLTGLD